MLGGDGIRDSEGLIGAVDEDDPTSRRQGGKHVIPSIGGLRDTGHLSDYGVSYRLVPGHQPGHSVRPVLGLDYHVDRRKGGGHRVVCHHHNLRRASEGRGHTNQTGYLTLGQSHVDVSRTNYDVYLRNRSRPEGHGGYRLGPANGVDLIDPSYYGRRQGHVDDGPVGTRWNTQDHLIDAGHPCRNGRHQDGGGIGGPTPRRVAPGTVYRPGDGPDDQTVVLGAVQWAHLGLVMPANRLGSRH